MKRYLIVLFVIICNLSQAQEYVTSRNNINFRNDSTTKSEVIRIFSKNTTVNLLEKGKKWSKVKYLNNTGYVRTKYLTIKNKTTSSENNKTSTYTLLFLLLFISSLFISRFLLQLTEFIENKYSKSIHERLFAKYLYQKLEFPDKVENMLTFFIGKNFTSYNSWTTRLIFISLFPLITSIAILIYKGLQSQQNEFIFPNIFDSISLTISIAITALIYLLLFAGIIFESLICHKKISIYRIPLLITSSILSLHTSMLGLTIISFYSVIKFSIKIGIILLSILLLFLSILTFFKINIRINDNLEI